MGLKENIEQLNRLTREAEAGGGEERLKKQHAQGRMTARERVEFLLDRGSFVELDKFKTHRITDFDMAERKIPGDGVRIQEGVVSLAGYADIFLRNVMSSGVVPQISAIMGPCAGGAVYSPAMTDFIVMVRDTSYMFLTGPDVIRAATHEEVTMQDLGGADTHSQKSGVCHLEADDDQDALLMIRELMSFIPSNNIDDPPFVPSSDDPNRSDIELDSAVPENPNKPYDMADIIRRVVDDGHFMEI